MGCVLCPVSLVFGRFAGNLLFGIVSFGMEPVLRVGIRSFAIPPIAAISGPLGNQSLLLHGTAELNLCFVENLSSRENRNPNILGPRVDTRLDGLSCTAGLVSQLDGKWSLEYHFCLASFQKQSCFSGSCGHQPLTGDANNKNTCFLHRGLMLLSDNYLDGTKRPSRLSA